MVARQFMQHYLPSHIASELNLDSLVMLNTTYISKQLESAFSDVVFSCEIAGKQAKLSVLIEHQSSPDRFMPIRVGHYLFSLLQRQIGELKSGLLPAAYCLVFYHGEPYPYSLSLADCFDDPLGLMENLFAKPLHLIDVSSLPDEQLRQQQLIGAFAQAMKHIRDADISPLVKEFLIRFHSETELDEGKLEFILALLQYAMHVGNSVHQHWQDVKDVAAQTPGKLGESVMTIAEMLQQEGVKKGIELGELKTNLTHAKRMLDKGYPVEEIIDITGLSVEQIVELKDQH